VGCKRSDQVLVVEDLVVEFPAGPVDVRVLDHVSFCLGRSEILGIVGETGSGKSMTLLSVMGMVPAPGHVARGRIRYGDRELVGLDHEAYRELRGREIGMVVQNPQSALNPLERVRTQIHNIYKANTELRGKHLEDHARSVLAKVGFRDVDRVLDAYPHQLSGGMAQRVLIAIALGPSPRVILVDEPTSGLDTTVGVRVMDTLQRSIRDTGAAGIVVTHDLGVVARYCDRAIVLNEGRVVDEASISTFFEEPKSEYRARLIDAYIWSGADSVGDRPAEDSRRCRT
jgi:ABC-type dipeptide/oligopeptide/nickel transport system ATPase component